MGDKTHTLPNAFLFKIKLYILKVTNGYEHDNDTPNFDEILAAQSSSKTPAPNLSNDTITSSAFQDKYIEERLSLLKSNREQTTEDSRANRQLRKQYAEWFAIGLGIQLLIMNIIIILVGAGCLKLGDATLQIFMGGTLLEVFGIVSIITLNLFPKKYQ